jgi:hypothetical protein
LAGGRGWNDIVPHSHRRVHGALAQASPAGNYLWSGAPMNAAAKSNASGARSLGRYFRRGPWEVISTAVIALGVIMLCQPFVLALYTYSFVTILAGTVMFTVVSKFPD